LKSERGEVEIELSRAEQALEARKHLTIRRADLVRETTRLRASVAALSRTVAELERAAQSADQLSELEEGERHLSEQAANLRAEIARDEKTLAEVRGGVCPILRDRCESFSAGQTYDDHFKKLIETHRARLSTVQAEAARVRKAVVVAREANVARAQLERERAQFGEEAARLSEREALLAQLDAQLDAIKFDAAALERLQIQLTGIDGELVPARDALQRFAQLVPLREALEEIETRGKRKREEREEQAAAAGAIDALDSEIGEIEARLRALNDPRGRAAALRVEAGRAASLETQAADARGVLKELEAERITCDARLARFADFDARWSTAAAERDRTAQAHREHLAGAGLAATVEARQAEVDGAAKESRAASVESEKAATIHERAVADYDATRHAAERDALSIALHSVATFAAQLEATTERAAALAEEIARLEEVRAQWQEELRAQQKLKRLDEATEFMRETLKKAGPEVTKSYVAHISVEANQLFREVTGEAGRTLRWTSDYEIVVEEGGYERSFVNLSGGEQVAAALAVRLALLKQLSDIRVAFFDEPTVNMDAERRENLARQIGQVTHFDQLFVISHDDTFEETVDHVLVLSRREEGMAA
jgi:exonuclease SbcC